MEAGEMIDASLREGSTIACEGARAPLGGFGQIAQTLPQIFEETCGAIFHGARLQCADHESKCEAGTHGEEDCAGGIFADYAIQVTATDGGLVFGFIHRSVLAGSFAAEKLGRF